MVVMAVAAPEVLAVVALPVFAAAFFLPANFLLAAELCLPELLLPELFTAALFALMIPVAITIVIAVKVAVAVMVGDGLLTELHSVWQTGGGGGFGGAKQSGGENGADGEYPECFMLSLQSLLILARFMSPLMEGYLVTAGIIRRFPKIWEKL